MVLWRISRHRDLSGAGGLRAGGRWHSAGTPVVYLSESPSAALLEVCVHTAAGDVPPDFTLLQVECKDDNEADPAITVIIEGQLPPDWRTMPEATRRLGTEWLLAGRSPLLRVPSALVPQTANYLLNPLHPEAGRFQITEVLTYPFDTRIKA